MDDSREFGAIAAGAEELRRAVEAGDFAGAEAAVRSYAGSIAQLSPASALAHADEACRLIDWARRTLSAARSRLRCVGEYHATQAAAIHTWRIDL